MIATNFNFLCIDEYISENYSKCGLTENDLHKKNSMARWRLPGLQIYLRRHFDFWEYSDLICSMLQRKPIWHGSWIWECWTLNGIVSNYSWKSQIIHAYGALGIDYIKTKGNFAVVVLFQHTTPWYISLKVISSGST